MTPKKARDNRRLRREQRQSPNLPPSQPQPASTSSPSSSPSTPAGLTYGDAGIAQFVLCELIQALQPRSSNPSSTNKIDSNPSRSRSEASSAALLAVLTLALASESLSSVALHSLLSAILDINPNPSRSSNASTSRLVSPTQPSSSSSTSAASEACAELDRLLASVLHNNTPIVGGLPVDVQETRSWNVCGSNSVDDIISEPSTSDNNSTIATRSSDSRSRTPQNYKQTKISNKMKKALWSKFRKVLEFSTTLKEKQEEVASLTEFCLRHIVELNVNTTTDKDNQAKKGGSPSPAGPDSDGATDEDGEGG